VTTKLLISDFLLATIATANKYIFVLKCISRNCTISAEKETTFWRNWLRILQVMENCGPYSCVYVSSDVNHKSGTHCSNLYSTNWCIVCTFSHWAGIF